MSDGSVIDHERARQFMDYYCRRFGFGKPDIAYQLQGERWEAVMTVGGRRIGLGAGHQKKTALQNCYMDVTMYLESCDAELWNQFLQDVKGGKDLGLAPSVVLQVDERLEDQIQTLCADIKQSTLFKNRPRMDQLMTGEDDPATMQQAAQTAPLYVPPRRRRATEEGLAQKSASLLERRKAYLSNPKHEKMRNTRAALPVFSKSQDLLDHIRNHDVTVCMAATGSGKGKGKEKASDVPETPNEPASVD